MRLARCAGPTWVLAIACLAVVALTAASPSPARADYNWSVQYLIDNSQTVLGNSQATYPRDNRGLAISPDGRYLYAGYNNSFNSSGEIRKIDLTAPDYTDATVTRLAGVRGKSIAVDDQGRVYIGEGGSIKIYDANLSTQLGTAITTTNCEGVAVVREGGSLALYATDRNNKTLSRWALTESGSNITGASLAGLGGTGSISVTGASNLRSLDVDSSGRIWMADPTAGKVFRVDNNGTGLISQSIAGAMDVGFYGGSAYVTGGTSRAISILSGLDLTITGTVTPPWTALALNPTGQSGGGSLSGLVMLADGSFYVTNETGQTANEKSTYGRTDANSGFSGGTFYTDLYADDNDPILHAAVPEPGSLMALGGGLIGLMGFAMRKRRY